MQLFLYNLGVFSYGFIIKLAALFIPKARKWIDGRKGWEESLQKATEHSSNWIWFHCASLGEFEMGRNLMEALKEKYPSKSIIITFFSPSGYDIRKNYKGADYVCYLPLDTQKNAAKFVEILSPELVVFVKYELWHHYLKAVREQNIPLLLISARMRPSSPYFEGVLADLYAKTLRYFTAIFTQDTQTAELLKKHTSHPQVIESADTRFDRVYATYERFEEVPEVAEFVGDRLCIVCGSTWPKAEQLLMESFQQISQSQDICMILAPHEIHESRIQQWVEKHPQTSIRHSQIGELKPEHNILWIDNIGMLSRLYHYADVAYVGGGWGTGLHNILEAVVFGKPVLFGPKHQKFPEAGEVIERGGAFEVHDQASLSSQLTTLLTQPELRAEISRTNQEYVKSKTGATSQILNWCIKEVLSNDKQA